MDSGEIVKFTMQFASPGASVGMMVFHYRLSGLGQDDEEVFDRLEDWAIGSWWADHSTLCDSATVLNSLKAVIVDLDGNDVRSIGESYPALNGSNPADPGAAAVSGFLTGLTGVAGVNGRKYVPFLADAVIGPAGVFDSIALGVLVQLAGHYLDQLVIDLVSYLTPGVRSDKVGAFLPFNGGATASNVPAYQRRRKPGVGI